jgi:peptidoglycan L-alanyl-D-glutamate endopeptidase CwlK
MLSQRDMQRLKGVRAELVDLAQVVSNIVPQTLPGAKLFITEGLRTVERQKQLVKAGASRTMNSEHLKGRAFDFGLMVNGKVRWDWPLFNQVGKIVESTAADLGIRVEWGGRWKKFPDGPHVQLAKDWP